MVRTMRHTLADLKIAQRHVEDGERRIAMLRVRITQLTQKDLPTDEALVLLGQMHVALEEMRWHRDQIAKEVTPDQSPS